ncbi:DUF2007 domain-containing protein [Porphyromonadaceae bacterium OttesenSCG-928-L07]|nr:DUF2007 domain-containing protein [Porphyromonadaceae bacterium OttesenSCG-928-L07]
MENERLITILTLPNACEIAIIRGRLESEGIACYVQDELAIQVIPYYANAIGGVRLQIKGSDLSHAVEILRETGYIKNDDSKSPEAVYQLDEYDKEKEFENNKVKENCPFCGSEEVGKFRKSGWLFLLSSLFMLFPTPFSHKKYYCFDCKKEFRWRKNVK